jgi:hypothetical protein
MIYRCIDKALAGGVQMGLKDAYHRPHDPEISGEAKAWVVSIACTKPKDHGLAAELWTISALARFVCELAEGAGFPRLARAGKSTVWRILDENQIKPHRIRYYLERRDPEFDRKMQKVLMVYRDVSLYREGAVHDARPEPIYTASVDETPGVQALGLTAPDLPPVPGRAAALGRDHEYVRHGTVSILAAIDLHSGHIFGNVEDRHRSVSSSRCSSGSMRTTRPRQSFAWCWTITRPTSPSRPWPISLPGRGASSMFTRPSMALGST